MSGFETSLSERFVSAAATGIMAVMATGFGYGAVAAAHGGGEGAVLISAAFAVAALGPAAAATLFAHETVARTPWF